RRSTCRPCWCMAMTTRSYRSSIPPGSPPRSSSRPRSRFIRAPRMASPPRTRTSSTTTCWPSSKADRHALARRRCWASASFIPYVARDSTMTLTAKTVPGSKLLSPDNHALILIDYQSQMSFATHSIDAITLRNNAGLVARAAASFKVPAILTTVAEKSFSGPMFEEVTAAFPGQALLDRTSMNTWEDAAVIKQVNAIGKPRLVFGGLWTSVCIVGPVLSAIEQGYEAYVVADACGDVSVEAHNRAMERMIQAG